MNILGGLLTLNALAAVVIVNVFFWVKVANYFLSGEFKDDVTRIKNRGR